MLEITASISMFSTCFTSSLYIVHLNTPKFIKESLAVMTNNRSNKDTEKVYYYNLNLAI